MRPFSGPKTGSRSGYAGLELTASGDEYGLSKRRLTPLERFLRSVYDSYPTGGAGSYGVMGWANGCGMRKWLPTAGPGPLRRSVFWLKFGKPDSDSQWKTRT